MKKNQAVENSPLHADSGGLHKKKKGTFTAQDLAEQQAEIDSALALCAKRINEKHRCALEHDRLSLEHAQIAIEAVIVAGKNLTVANVMLPHGEWEKWFK